MDVYFDTSVLVAALLLEPRTGHAGAVWGRATRVWAWRWAELEVESALAQRNAPPAAWAQWRQMAGAIHWLDLEPALWPALRAFNRPLKMRAADAGHLFVFERALTAVGGMELATFDREMERAAEWLGLPRWQVPPETEDRKTQDTRLEV